MKRTAHKNKLRLNAETVRMWQLIDDPLLQQIHGGRSPNSNPGGSGGVACSR